MKKKEDPTKAYSRVPKEISEYGMFRKNYDYGEGPFHGKPQSIPEFRKRKLKRQRRKRALQALLDGLVKSNV